MKVRIPVFEENDLGVVAIHPRAGSPWLSCDGFCNTFARSCQPLRTSFCQTAPRGYERVPDTAGPVKSR